MCLHRGIEVGPLMKMTYWLELFCAALQVLSCWPVILLQALGIYCWHWHQTGSSGMDWGSPPPGIFSLKHSSPAWQADDWRCSSLSLSDGPHQPPVEQFSQSDSHELSSRNPACGTSPVAICWFVRFHWPFQTPSLWLEGLTKKLIALQSPSPPLPGLCNPSWYCSDCS